MAEGANRKFAPSAILTQCPLSAKIVPLWDLPGGMAEWLNAAVLKTAEVRKGFRGFESLSLRCEI